MKTALHCLLSAAVAAGATYAVTAEPAARALSSEAILQRYVDDFRADPAAAEARVFGVRITGEDGGEWTVAVGGVRDVEGLWQVELVPEAPWEPTFVYVMDGATLAAIDAGRTSALTAQGKAFPGDPSPLEVEWLEGAEVGDVNAFSFHFWTRGLPERASFDRARARVVHGVDTVPLYYQPGLRCIWSSIAKGQRANNGPDQPIVVPFPALVLSIRGRAVGTIGGEPVELPAGEMVFVPPNTPYEWWNEDDQPAEALLVFFGEGA